MMTLLTYNESTTDIAIVEVHRYRDNLQYVISFLKNH